MSRVSAPTAPPAAERSGAEHSTTVALIAEQTARAQLREALAALGVEFTVFADVDGLLAHRTENAGDPELVVVRLDVAAAAPGRLIERLRQGLPQALVVVICADLQRREIRAVLAAGAAGVVLEEELGRALGPCLQVVQAGQICVPQAHWRQIEPPALSTREKQILGLVVMGYMNSQIAERLFLAESTVKSHLSSAFGKLGVRSRNEAVNLILDSKRGLGMGILGLGGERLETTSAAAP